MFIACKPGWGKRYRRLVGEGKCFGPSRAQWRSRRRWASQAATMRYGQRCPRWYRPTLRDDSVEEGLGRLEADTSKAARGKFAERSGLIAAIILPPCGEFEAIRRTVL